MATILEFRPRGACRDTARAGDQSDARDDADGEAMTYDGHARRQTTCDILFFTGVRYSREGDAPAFAISDEGDGARSGA